MPWEQTIVPFTKLCLNCWNIMERGKYDRPARYSEKHFCSTRCALIYRNTHVSPEKARAMAIKGYATRKKRIAEGKLQPYRVTEETKQKISARLKIASNTPEHRAIMKALPCYIPGTPEYIARCAKVSASHMGIRPTPEQAAAHGERMKKYWAEHPHPLIGYQQSEEQRRHHSLVMIGKQVGDKHHNWKGGVSLEEYGSGWTRGRKKLVKERDNHTCQLCFALDVGDKRCHSVHHIDFNKNHNTFENLITLCNRCNCKVNYNRDFWIIHFQALMATDFMVEANSQLPLFVKPKIKHAILK